MDRIFDYVSAETIILLLLVWNVLGAYYGWKWQTQVNKRLARLEGTE